jgi:hypothetical protein
MRRYIKALHTLRDFGHGHRCFRYASLRLSLLSLAAIPYIQVKPDLAADFERERKMAPSLNILSRQPLPVLGGLRSQVAMTQIAARRQAMWRQFD